MAGWMDGWDGELEWERNGIVKDVMLHIIFFLNCSLFMMRNTKMIPGLILMCVVGGGLCFIYLVGRRFVRCEIFGFWIFLRTGKHNRDESG